MLPRRPAGLGWWPILGAVAAVAALTLYPGSSAPARDLGWCLICGTRGTADAVLNVVLYAPLGMGLGFLGWTLPHGALAGGLLSALIEGTQHALPGRDPSIADIVFNTTGAAVGTLAGRWGPRWLLPPARHAARGALLAASAATAVFAATGWLLQPSFPHAPYYGQWTPQLGHLEWYRGRVLRAAVDDIQIPPYRLSNSATVRAALLDRPKIAVTAVAGPTTSRLASLMSIYDASEREIVLVGPDRGDLVFRYRARARTVRLDQPDLRLRGVMRAVAPGDTVLVEVYPDRDYCVALDQRRACGLGFTVGSGWTLLWYPAALPPWVQTLFGAGWVGALLVPFGLWARRGRAAVAGVGVLAAGLLLVPAQVGLLPTLPAEMAGALAGVGCGALLSAISRQRLADS